MNQWQSFHLGTLRVVLSSVLLSSCSESVVQPELGPPPPPDVRAYVIGPALENLDSEGHFRLALPVGGSSYPAITPDRAVALASAFVKSFSSAAAPVITGPPGLAITGLAESVEEQHGSRIDWRTVRALARTPYFAESHLASMPSAVGQPAIRAYGPQYVVTLYSGPTPVLVAAVSAHSTNLAIDGSGSVYRIAGDGGGEFFVGGVPVQLLGLTMPPSPESAVEFAFAQTGSRVVTVPALGLPGNRVSRIGARWQLRLEHPVAFERNVDGALITTSDVFVAVWPSIADARLGYFSQSLGLRLLVASYSQPRADTINGLELPIREGYLVDLNEVRVRR